MTRLRRAALLCRGRLTSRSCCLVSAQPCVSLLRGDVLAAFRADLSAVTSLYCRSETAAQVLFPGRRSRVGPSVLFTSSPSVPVLLQVFSSTCIVVVFHTELQQQSLSSGAALQLVGYTLGVFKPPQQSISLSVPTRS